jgi:hypothetical protein
MWRLIWKWLATRAASFWIASVAGIALTVAVGYVQQLRVKAARCQGQEDIREQVERLTDRVVKNIEETTDDQIRAIRQTPDQCADLPVPDVVIDSLRSR